MGSIVQTLFVQQPSTLASTSSTPPDQCKTWDAFISFRGKDIRQGFVSHLHDALLRKQINAFLDKNLDKGQEISSSLLETIEKSYISVVIFSENYADSPWCLDELVKILECKKTSGQMVLPIFYHVDPADVQELRGNFGKAFRKHKKDVKKEKEWRHALKEISNLAGWDSESRNIKSESELVEEIVNVVLEKLNHIFKGNYENDDLVGIESRVKKMEELLFSESINNKRVVGIWGMGGIGKTTLAEEVFHRIKAKFESHCFVANVREEITKQTSNALRDKIFCQLLGEKDGYIGTPRLGDFTRTRLQSKKVLLIFDDVDDSYVLKGLGGNRDWYNKGSRIIITSRDRQTLINVCLEEHIYEVKELIDHEALHLFSLYAFKQDHPKEGYEKLSEIAIRYAQGNPLALRVLGSNLYSKGIEDWESELKKLKEIPDLNIQKVLRISYDNLDRYQKSIFLDIACFFKGEPRGRVEGILDACGLSARSTIGRLIDKSLITISSSNYVGMHDLLQQMGKEIAYEESKQPGASIRLWNYNDICRVLSTEMGTQNVESILLNMYEAKDNLVLSSTAFKKMYTLRFLKFFNVSNSGQGQVLLPSGLEFLPEGLRYLYWDRYPSKYLPLKGCTKYLVELHMPSSNLKELWNGDEARVTDLGNLRLLDLSHSFELTRVPDLSSVPNLEFLRLSRCLSLIEIPSSIGELKCLKELNLSVCSKLHSIPRSICNLKSLTLLDISCCRNVNGLPENIGNLELLQKLEISSSRIKALPSSINQLKNLASLVCSGCEGLTLPPLTGLSCLLDMELGYCGILEIPQNLGCLVSLRSLYLNESNFESIPASIKQLSQLEILSLDGCKRLKLLPELPCLKLLRASGCTSLESASTSFLFTEHEVKDGTATFLEFRNCINLEKEKVMEDVLETHLLKDEIVELCIPGDEVPQRMRYKNQSGSSISFTLDKPNLIGVSLCLVFDPKNHYVSPGSKHVCLWNKLFYMEGSFVRASFQFCLDKYPSSLKCVGPYTEGIIKCGVHPIYVQDNGGCRDKKRSRNQEDEEEEPSPLRLKQDQKPYNSFKLSCTTLLLSLIMASTSSTSPSYDVFISYRGKDIRDGFVSHLFNAFQQKQINTFLDENLCKGEEISPVLLATIEESYVSVMIFSENYADS
ncbi:disease resistance protein RUN1-like isoform X3 [Hevea brasiliensis]|uniref:disease resistance protein RUN1-like isoform X3 n=1 Tax=Hevea brasiliensis TaxID=3981 RepID=UPI0025FAD5C3|nr:disease resistance protein RUN1-like isoform X3 [Hevea brasiliensis]